MSQTHTAAEWAEVLSLAAGVHATYSAVWFVLVDAHRSDFPRLWQAAVNARHDMDWAVASALHLADDVVIDARLTLRAAVENLRRALVDAALTAAALLTLLTLLTTPETHR